MTKCSAFAGAALLLGIALAAPSFAQPITGEEFQRQTKVLDRLKKALAAETTDGAKFAHIERAMKGEDDANFRHRILAIAVRIPGPELEKFLTDLLIRDDDAGLRIEAARTLGRTGSEKCLTALAEAARNDRTTHILFGDLIGQSSARRAATFAIAELAARFPKLADDAAGKLRSLPAVEHPRDRESLSDARAQALYQVTHDEKLLTPFLDRLRSKDAKVRESGVVAFRFLKLKVAPPELMSALGDADSSVRSWAGLALGEIGDPKTVPVLLAVAGDAKKDAGLRCNVIGALGQMKAAAATQPMRKLLTDESEAVQTQAAIALYRLTGEKVKQFPAGYNAN
ncbi:MAG TPA: HEAT repeat domain-containing protein [Gemmataceae bacterium]|jgi:HEAT repeat protein|nr:HEAT repeat domain-containing protein [Gemmataceae bacterium]